jgi:PAS domain S-box-containing protein
MFALDQLKDYDVAMLQTNVVAGIVFPNSLCQAIVESSPLAVVVFSLPHLVATSANASFLRLTGLAADKLHGARWADLAIWARPEEADKTLMGATRGRPCLNAPVEMRTVTGEYRSVFASSSVIDIEQGAHLVIHLHDMTAARESERALLWQYEQLDWQRRETAAILDAVDEAIVLVSPDWRLANANRRFCDLIGMPADDLLGLQINQVRPQLKYAFGNDQLPNLLEWRHDEEALDVPVHLRQLTPVERDYELTVTDIRGADRTEHGRLFALRDITRQLEADRIKDEFIATVSHELRTPLTSIAGFVQLLLDGSAGHLNEDAGRFLGIIQRNVGHLIEQVNELLDFSRLQAGVVHITPGSIDAGAVVHEVVSLLGPQFGGRQQSLTVDIPPAVPPVWADNARLAQILVNLLTNASKFTPIGGAIRIRIAAGEHDVRFEVADTGVGLSEADQRLIFSRFYRVPSASRQAPGSGLGLPIAQILVERQGGRIQVTSEPGAGSIFSFTIPRADCP